jgi:hypothetical protein
MKTAWQERWFHLSGATLRWSDPGQKDKSDAAGGKGTAVLQAVELVGADLHVATLHATKDTVTYVLRASNTYEAEMWHERMELGIAKAAAPDGAAE